MRVSHTTRLGTRQVKVLAAVVIGLSVGTLVPPEPVVLPLLGTASGLLVGGIGLVVGAALYVYVPGHLDSGCGCSDDCECS